MSFAKPASAKYASASKSGSRFDALFRDRSALRFLLANIGGVSILAATTLLRSSGDASEFTYEIVLMIVGVVVYLIHASKVKAPKGPRDNRASTRTPNRLRELPATREESKKLRVRQTPTFSAVGWDAEIDEFLHQVSPTDKADAILLSITKATSACIKSIVPEAKVTAFTSVNLFNNHDVGSLEADVSIDLEPAILAERMEAFRLKKMAQRPPNDHQRPQCAIGLQHDDLAKMTLRMLTRELGQAGVFLFHHCSYKEREPKVVLRVPVSRGLTDRDIFVTFTVNCPTPTRTATLGQQLKLFDHKALELGLLARRWARDRGIAYAAKGHLSTYTWTCLAGFYCQQRCGGATDKLMFGLDHKQRECGDEACGTIGAMFKDFLRFYADFDWNAGVISLRLGRQVAWPDSSLGHSVVDGCVLGIEDPFEPTRNIAETITSWGFERLLEEFSRARDIAGMACQSDAGRDCVGFKQLLEAWTAAKDTP